MTSSTVRSLSSNSSMSAPLEALPLELLEHVLHFLEKRDLKALRLSSRFLQSASTPLLFEDFTIYPHVESFKDLHSISLTPLRRHVHKIYYETRYRGILSMAQKRLQSVWSKDISEEDMGEMRRVADTHRDGTLSIDDVPGTMLVHVSLLQEALQALTNVVEARIVEPRVDEEWVYHANDYRMPSFYAKLLAKSCDRYPHTRLERDAYGLSTTYREDCTFAVIALTALRTLSASLTSIIIDDARISPTFDSEYLSREVTSFLDELWANLRHFKLTSCTRRQVSDLEAYRGLEGILRKMINLEKLDLTLRQRGGSYITHHGDELVDVEAVHACETIFYVPQPIEEYMIPAVKRFHTEMNNDRTLRPTLIGSARLRRLTLLGLVCTESEFRQVLKPCLNTLTHLNLGGLIITYHDIQDPRTCLVSLFKWLQSNFTSLEDVHLEGTFSNCGLQQWHARVVPDMIGIREEMEDFVLHGGYFPLEDYAIQQGYFDLNCKTSSMEDREEAANELSRLGLDGDESWEVTYLGGHDFDEEDDFEHEDDFTADFDEDDDEDEDEDELEDDEFDDPEIIPPPIFPWV